jgi:hypothetical protein
MADVTFKQREGDTLKFVLTRNNAVVVLTGKTFSFVVKSDLDATTYLIEKQDADFDKTDAALGIVYVPITTSDTDLDPGTYYAELKSIITASTDEDLSITWTFKIERAVHN